MSVNCSIIAKIFGEFFYYSYIPKSAANAILIMNSINCFASFGCDLLLLITKKMEVSSETDEFNSNLQLNSSLAVACMVLILLSRCPCLLAKNSLNCSDVLSDPTADSFKLKINPVIIVGF